MVLDKTYRMTAYMSLRCISKMHNNFYKPIYAFHKVKYYGLNVAVASSLVNWGEV
jgi:hypothetical protein